MIKRDIQGNLVYFYNFTTSYNISYVKQYTFYHISFIFSNLLTIIRTILIILILFYKHLAG